MYTFRHYTNIVYIHISLHFENFISFFGDSLSIIIIIIFIIIIIITIIIIIIIIIILIENFNEIILIMVK